MTDEAAPPYHHGALPQALIDATEALLAERGPEAFSLREVARRAGVSPAAPAHHFGDAAGLLTAVATLGFRGLTQALRDGDARGADDPVAALREQGLAYVRFALQHPGRFRLMFRDGLLHKDPPLLEQANAAFQTLAQGVQRALGSAASDAAARRNATLALWSLVHGYAHLAIAGRFDRFDGGMDRRQFIETTLPAVLNGVLGGLFPPLRRVRRG
jgi:AcrR family transcriptional regulator